MWYAGPGERLAPKRWTVKLTAETVLGVVSEHNLLTLKRPDQLIKGDIVLADRGFCSFGCLAALQQLGIDCVMRLQKARSVDFRRGQRLGKADRLLERTKPRR